MCDGFFKYGFVAIDVEALHEDGRVKKVFVATIKESLPARFEKLAAKEMELMRHVVKML